MQFKFHKSFQLNGTSFYSNKELVEFSKTISFEISSFLSDFLTDNETIDVKTSGSTGTPKRIEIKKEFMINSALATGDFFNLKQDTKALLCMNPSFIAGKMMLVRAMVLGWKLDVVTPSSNPLKGVNKIYDFCAMVPMQVHHSFNDLHKIKKLIIGGGVLSKELETKLKLIKTTCFATYGMTETVTHIAVKRVNGKGIKVKDSQSVSSSAVERSFYRVLPNVKISKDKRGCLVIDAPKVAKNKLVTNDLVDLISDTEFQWLGRYDNIINSGGIKLIPEQIEEKLAKIIEPRFFVAGIKDAVLGEKLVLVVEEGLKVQRLKETREKRSKFVASSAVEKSQNLKSQITNLKILSKYEIPKEIYFVEKFVETTTKKIQRNKTLDLIVFY